MRRWGVAALVGQLLLGAARVGGEQSADVEMRQKATFVGRLLKFVEWPEGGKAGGVRFVFCVAGNSFLSFAMSQELRGTLIEGRGIGVRSIKKEGDLAGCDAAYFTEAARASNWKWLEKLKGTKALTVGEGGGFLSAGGMVEIACQNQMVQFEVNLDAVRSAGLKIDARLLELAKEVKRRDEKATR